MDVKPREGNKLYTLTPQKLVANFEMLGGWEERYAYIIDLGRKLPPMDEADKTEENRVLGCQSQVWVRAGLFEGESDKPLFEFLGDSDSTIVRGLVALCMIVYQHQPPKHVAEYDILELFKELGLDNHLSPSRGNGLRSMVRTLRAHAERLSVEAGSA